MSVMRISDLRIRADGAATEYSALIQAGRVRQRVWYRVTGAPVAQGADPLLAAALVPAMRLGMPLSLPGVISPRLAGSVSTIQDILCSWFPDFRRVDVKVRLRHAAAGAPGRGVACFFSGGVDSLYSVVKHQPDITHFVFVHGFDIKLRNAAMRRTVSASLREAAAAFGKPLIEVESNLRDFSNRHALWGEHYHGSAFASVSLLLSPAFHTIYLAASHTYAHVFPRGSSVLLDQHWSTEDLRVVHDGCEATRVQKIARLADSPEAMKYLRVCFENRDGQYNCGRCEKCLRTMVGLHLAGALGRCATFKRPLEPFRVARVPATEPPARIYMEENLEAAQRQGADPVLIRALRDSLAGVYRQGVRGWPRRLANRLLQTQAIRRARVSRLANGT